MMIEIIDYILHIFDEKPGLLRLTFFTKHFPIPQLYPSKTLLK